MAPVNVHTLCCGAFLGLTCGIALPMHAAATEATYVQIAATLGDEIARSVLPARISLPPGMAVAAFGGADTAMLAELGYCGSSETGIGRFRAVVFQHGVGKAQRLLSIPDSCRLPLAELAKPAATLVGRGQALVIADVEVTFKAWELKVSLVRAVPVRGGDGGLAPPVSHERADVASLSTGPLRFDLGGSPVYVHVSPSFGRRSIDLGIAVTEKLPPKSVAEVAAATRLLDGDATIAAELPLATVNLVLRRLTGVNPVTVPLEGDSVDVRNVGVRVVGSGTKAAVTVTGTATPRSIQETMNWTLQLAGDPLLVSTVRAAARVQDCASLRTLAAVACDLANGARVAGAEAFAAALTNRYGGRAASVLASPIRTEVPIAGRNVHFGGDVLRMAWGSRGLVATGSFSAAPAE